MPPHHDADHGQSDEGCGAAHEPLEIAGQSSVVTDPADRALDDPAFREHDEAVLVAAPDDLHLPWSGSLNRRSHSRPLVSGIADDPFDERELATHLTKQGLGAITILDIGWMHQHAQQQAKCIGQDVALAAKGLLARVIARRVERRPPF